VGMEESVAALFAAAKKAEDMAAENSGKGSVKASKKSSAKASKAPSKVAAQKVAARDGAAKEEMVAAAEEMVAAAEDKVAAVEEKVATAEEKVAAEEVMAVEAVGTVAEEVVAAVPAAKVTVAAKDAEEVKVAAVETVVKPSVKKATARSLSVAVGSKNPVKVESVRRAFSAAFADAAVNIFPYDVSSGVSDQPWGDRETREGALNRARACQLACHRETGAPPAFAVGLEGGVADDHVADEHPHAALGEVRLPEAVVQCFAWMVILRGEDVAMGRTATVTLPSKVVSLMRADPPLELGAADDKVFNEINSKQKGGTVVKLTRGLIDRTEYYEHALKLALAPFLHDESGLYAEPPPPPPPAPPPPPSVVLEWARAVGEAFVSLILPFLMIGIAVSMSNRMPGKPGDDTSLHSDA